MIIEIYNELNGIDIDIVENATHIERFDFAMLYPNDKEENGNPIVIQHKGDKNGNDR